MKVLSPAIVLLASLLLATSSLAYLQADGANVDEVAEKLFCTCGCNMLLSVCETQMTCEVAKGMKAEVKSMVDEGLTEDEILELMKKRYGSTVLAVPPKEGFTLSLWTYPVIGIVAGLLIIYAISKRRGAKWYVDPDEVPELTEEEIRMLEEGLEGSEEVQIKYEKLLKEKYKEHLEKEKRPGEDA